MNYIANFSVVSIDRTGLADGLESDMLQQDLHKENSKQNDESVFCQADLWNLQKQMRRIHVTDRFPRTWEGAW
jgi:hypothetical protein